jgi:hypothetical protein
MPRCRRSSSLLRELQTTLPRDMDLDSSPGTYPRKLLKLMALVALTGIEWVSCCFSSSQFVLSSSFSVFLVHDESSLDLYKKLWCDPRVTATASCRLVGPEASDEPIRVASTGEGQMADNQAYPHMARSIRRNRGDGSARAGLSRVHGKCTAYTFQSPSLNVSAAAIPIRWRTR